MLGQIASFMENLHLSYEETVYKIPYRSLLMMQKDKLLALYGEVMKEVTPEEMLGSRLKDKFS